MAWHTLNSYTTSDAVTDTIMNGVGNDFRTWGGNVDAGGYALANLLSVAGPTGANPLLLYTNGAERMRITSGGNVGIGTNVPASSRLDVRDTDCVVQMRSSLSAMVTGVNNGGAIYFGVDNANSTTQPTAAIETSWGGGTNPQIAIGVTRGAIGAHLLMNFSSQFFFKNGATNVMFIDGGSGRVGIGTIAPTSPLHVIGIPVYANNAAAVTGGLTAGALYRTGGNPDPVCVVH